MQDVLRNLRPQLWYLALGAAFVDFIVVDVMNFVHRSSVGGSLAELQSRWAPFVSNLTLIAAAALVALLLPGFVRTSGPGTRRTNELLVVLGLLILGLNAIRYVRPWPWLVTVIGGLLLVSLLVALWRVRRAGLPRPWGWLAMSTVIALMLPHLHRITFDVAASGSGEGAGLTSLRVAGDALVVLAFVALVLLPPRPWPPTLIEILAAVPAIVIGGLLVFRYDQVHDILTKATGLWLTALPPFVFAVLIPIGTFAVLRLWLHGLRAGGPVGLALAVMLFVFAGFLPIRPENQLLCFAGALVMTAWSSGRIDSMKDVPELLF